MALRMMCEMALSSYKTGLPILFSAIATILKSIGKVV